MEEYYLYHPQTQDLIGWQRTETGLDFIEEMKGWVSPRLGVRFDVAESGLQMYRPDGERFLTFLELGQQRREAEQRLQTVEEQLEATESAIANSSRTPTRNGHQSRIGQVYRLFGISICLGACGRAGVPKQIYPAGKERKTLLRAPTTEFAPI